MRAQKYSGGPVCANRSCDPAQFSHVRGFLHHDFPVFDVACGGLTLHLCAGALNGQLTGYGAGGDRGVDRHAGCSGDQQITAAGFTEQGDESLTINKAGPLGDTAILRKLNWVRDASHRRGNQD